MNINYVKNENDTITITISEEQFENHLCLCEDCGKVMFINEATMLENRYYCGGCLATCDECGRIIRREDVYLAEDADYTYCHECFLEETIRCADCGNRYRYDDSLHEVDGNWYCDDCYEDHRPIINDYHNQKNYGDIVFYGDADRRENLYLGFELEIDSNHSFDREKIAAELKSRFGDFFAYENDGSLHYGFEMISQPATLDYHLGMMPRYRDAFRYLLDNGIKSHDVGTCGLHFHASRMYLGAKEDSSIAKLLYLSEKFRPQLIRFSRRTEEQAADWCRSRKQNVSNGSWIKKVVLDSKEYTNYQDRYYAINLTNTDTIELRLFRGTLNAETFEATIKFVARLFELCKNVRAVDLAKFSFEDLLDLNDPVVCSYWNRINNK